MQYNYKAKNTGKDFIYWNRLKLIKNMNINVNKNPKIYSYYMDAYMGIILN